MQMSNEKNEFVVILWRKRVDMLKISFRQSIIIQDRREHQKIFREAFLTRFFGFVTNC